MKEPKITYFTGAGASFYSVPIINELQKQIGLLPSKVLNEGLYNNMELKELKDYIQGVVETPEGFEPYSMLLSQLRILSENSKQYSTIDTYALYTKYHNPKEYLKVKHLINWFFTLWQSQENEDYEGKKKWEEIDPRYIGLISAIIRKEDKILLSDNINFITWNYDTQIEKALHLFTDRNLSLLEVCKKSRVYPVVQNENCKIVHLNGISGFFRVNYNVFEMVVKHGVHFPDKAKTFAEDYSEDVKIEQDSTLINFSWDTETLSNNAIQRAISLLEKTNYLVIIGYSFPLFNREADVIMMNALPYNCKIVIQNPNFTKQMFIEYFGETFKERTIMVKEESQFFIPSEYFTELKKEDKNIDEI